MDPLSSEPDQAPVKQSRLRRPKILDNELVSILLFIVGVLIVYFIIQAFLLRSYQVDGQSMERTLQNNDRLIIDKVPRTIARITGNAYIPHRGDIVVFDQAGSNYDGAPKKQLIKRVIGLPGEQVVIKDGSITVYNQTNPGGFNPDNIGIYHIGTTATPGDIAVTLTADQLFVSGDNRTNSEDSRYFGPITADKIVGKLSLRILPISKAQRF